MYNESKDDVQFGNHISHNDSYCQNIFTLQWFMETAVLKSIYIDLVPVWWFKRAKHIDLGGVLELGSWPWPGCAWSLSHLWNRMWQWWWIKTLLCTEGFSTMRFQALFEPHLSSFRFYYFILVYYYYYYYLVKVFFFSKFLRHWKLFSLWLYSNKFVSEFWWFHFLINLAFCLFPLYYEITG